MKYGFLLLCSSLTFVPFTGGLASAAPPAKPDVDVQSQFGDATDAFKSYMNQAFLTTATANQYQTALQDLVGQYLTITNNQPTIYGDSDLKNPTPSGSIVQFKSNVPFTLSQEQTGNFGLQVLSFFGLKASADKLYQITATNAATVINPSNTGSACIGNRPGYLKTGVEYFCISGVTLSTVVYNQYLSQKIGAQGDYVVTANGTYQMDNKARGEITKISYTVYGPFMGDEQEKIVAPKGPALAMQFAGGPSKAPAALPVDASWTPPTLIKTSLIKGTRVNAKK
jgi:hypothetical protein